MSAFFSPVAIGGAADAARPAALMPLVLTTLLILLFEKALVTNVAGRGHRRLSRFLDVGIAPLALGSLVLALTQLARVLGQGA